MFYFRILTDENGGFDVIDETLKTPYSALTLEGMLVYKKVEEDLYTSKSLKRMEQRKKRIKKPLYKKILEVIA